MFCVRFVSVVLIFVEAGLDPPAKLASWLHPPFGRIHSLIRCGIRYYVQKPLHLPYWGAVCSPQTQKNIQRWARFRLGNF